MKNETIKQFTPITVEQAGEMLRAFGWSKPVEGLAFRDYSNRDWNYRSLTGIDVRSDTSHPFGGGGQGWENCAKVTEIDPCQAPDGCHELEPWMAYVSWGCIKAAELVDAENVAIIPFLFDEWSNGDDSVWYGFHTKSEHYAIDVRTAWAQEHFPEHCRIRNYQEPDPFSLLVSGMRRPNHIYGIVDMHDAYKEGQNNPNPTK